MKIRTTVLAGVLVAALPLAASAAAPRYTYLGASYVTTDQDGDGYAFDGSLAITPNIHFFGGYAIVRDNKAGALAEERSAYNFGLGYNYALRPNLDLVGRISYDHKKCRAGDTEYADCYFNGYNDYYYGATGSKSGYGLEALLRWQTTDRLEIDAGVMRNNEFGNFDAATYLEAGIWYDVLPNVALGGYLQFADSTSSYYTVGARYYIGKKVTDFIK
jgi:hypothetical protein